MLDDHDDSACTAWTSFAFGQLDVVAHRSSVTVLSPHGVRQSARHDWFAAARDTDRWVVFHRSEHPDAASARAALLDGHRDLEWQTQLLGRSGAELLAAPLAVADLQRAALAGLAPNAARLRAALPDERAEAAGLAPPPSERPPSPDDLPPLAAALPPDPAADRTPLARVLPARTAHVLHRHGHATLLDVSRLTACGLAHMPGLDEAMRREIVAALRRHGLLLAPERPALADLRARRAERRRQAVRFGELLSRGYAIEEIAQDAGRSVGYVRMVLGDRVA